MVKLGASWRINGLDVLIVEAAVVLLDLFPYGVSIESVIISNLHVGSVAVPFPVSHAIPNQYPLQIEFLFVGFVAVV